MEVTDAHWMLACWCFFFTKWIICSSKLGLQFLNHKRIQLSRQYHSIALMIIQIIKKNRTIRSVYMYVHGKWWKIPFKSISLIETCTWHIWTNWKVQLLDQYIVIKINSHLTYVPWQIVLQSMHTISSEHSDKARKIKKKKKKKRHSDDNLSFYVFLLESRFLWIQIFFFLKKLPRVL